MKNTAQHTSQAFIVLILAAVVSVSAFAHHLASNNRLTFAATADSLSPDAGGMGTVNYLPGTSDEDDESAMLNASFTFMGLEPHMFYTVVVRAAFSEDQTSFDAICSFTTNAAGTGGCQTQIVGLLHLQVAQLRLGDENGPVVLQATREGFGPGPGMIESRGGCRLEAGETCQAPGRQ